MNFLQMAIDNGSLISLINKVIEVDNEEKNFNMYLSILPHYPISYEEFISKSNANINNHVEVSREELDKIYKDSEDILNKFKL